MRKTRLRDRAFRALFENDLAHPDLSELLARSTISLTPTDQAELTSLITGCITQQTQLDQSLQPYLRRWSLARLAPVDRAILRLATYEWTHPPHLPPAALLSEAIKLANRYGTPESPAFINGILNNLIRHLPLRPAPCTSAHP